MIALSKNTEGSDEEGEEEEEEESSTEEDAFSDLVYESDSETDVNKSKDTSVKKSPTKKKAAAAYEANKGTKVKILTDEERKAMMEKAQKELPYTFELPQKYKDLEKLLKKYGADHQAVILERMIKCNHPKVEPTNRERMTTLFAFLLQYVNDLASGDDPVHCFTVLDRILPFLYDLSHINPADTTKCFLEVIKEKQFEYRGSKEFPPLDTLVFLRIVSSLYSVSDFRHGIASPCVIFISQILTHSRVSNRSDISSGLFLVTVLLEYTQLSKRYLPAALNFLAGVLYLSIRKKSVHQIKVVPPFKSVGELSSLLVLKKQTAFDAESRLIATDLTETEIDNSFKVRAFNTTVQLVIHIFSNLNNCGLQFLAEPFSKYLDKIDLKHYPEECKENVSALLKVIERINSEPLTFLVPELKRPKTLRQLEPKYERIYDDRRDRSKNAGNAAIRKGLQRKIKKETKGAVREIRRDNAFLSKVQLKRKLHRYVFFPRFPLKFKIFDCIFNFHFLPKNTYIHFSSKFIPLLSFFSSSFTAMLNVEIRSSVSSPKLRSNKANSMHSIERRNTSKIDAFASYGNLLLLQIKKNKLFIMVFFYGFFIGLNQYIFMAFLHGW